MSEQQLTAFTEIGRRLVQKWGGLVENIENPTVRVNTAILLENEAQKGGVLVEDTQSGQTGGASVGAIAGTGANGDSWGASQGAGNDIAPFQHYLLPLVRRVYPNLIANELVGVQPMTSPASLVFYLKYRYTGLVDLAGSVSEQFTDGSGSPNNQYNPLRDVARRKGQTAAGTEYGNFIGNTWNIDPYYSLQKIFQEPMAVNATSHDLVAAPKIVGVPAVVRWTFSDGAIVARDEGAAAHTLVRAGSIITSAADVTTGAVTVDGQTLTTAAAVATAGSPVPVVTATDVTYEYDMEGNRQLPEIELEVASNPVTASTRKLRTKWTIEASQDLRAMHNVDAEQELVALLANEVTAEIDREIINELIVNALIRIEYDYANPFLVGGTSAQTGGTFAIPGATNFDDRNKSLFYQILEVSNQIYRQSLRGAGNWIVTSPEVAAKLESLLEFKPDARTDFQYNLGIQFSGSLNGQFRVFKDPLFPRDLILVGYKGNSFMDAGFFYCPYVPLQLTPTVLDPESFNPRKGLVTRYGKVMVENGARMYGVIRVNNLSAVGADILPGDAQVAANTIDPQKASIGGPGDIARGIDGTVTSPDGGEFI